MSCFQMKGIIPKEGVLRVALSSICLWLLCCFAAAVAAVAATAMVAAVAVPTQIFDLEYG